MLFMQLCVRSMASLETIGPLMSGMKCRPDMAGLACEALNRMFQKEQTELVAQVNIFSKSMYSYWLWTLYSW